MSLNERELLELKQEMEEAKQSVAEHRGQLTALMKQLKDNYKCNTLEQAQKKLDQFMQQYGKTIPAPTPVTQLADKAQVAPPVSDIGLKGMIQQVNLENSWVEISIGSANGVREEMTFHATRGDQFICDIVIFEVDTDKAIGKLELVQDSPKAGDLVSTNL